MRANFIFSEVWIGLRRNLTMTVAVIITVAVGMAMLGVGLMINSQVKLLQDYWYDKVEISAFLCSSGNAMPSCKGKGISPGQTTALKTEIEAMAGVESASFENQAQAYENFKANYGSNPALVQVARAEDMPESFRIKLKDPDNFAPIIDQVSKKPGVAQVIHQKDLIGKFFDFLEKLRSYALGVALVLVLAAALLIGNTVRLSAFNRRRETGIMRLVGASNLYIQLPFVMEGVIAGLIGGVFAAVMLIVTKVFIFESLTEYVAINNPIGWDDVAQHILLTMLIGVVICILASFVTLRRYLRV
ncbi:permease-like cell division protein FtsX [Nonomuraea longicatena]|uniref:Cell division protein FtsX n=1 Tax=Nonomuraea longicatena TaxID=83682 RepID=A0ABN1QXG4_9ACTN